MVTDRSVLVVGGNEFPFHRLSASGPYIETALSDAVNVTLATDRDALSDLDGYAAVVDYTTDSTFTDGQRNGLLSFVESGGGYLGIHCAADLTSTVPEDPDSVIDSRDEPIPELRELLGGHFLTHPDQTAFDVRIVNHYHPVTATLSDFRVWDEPYVLDVDDDVDVLARMDHPEHADMPVVWTREYGDGRVLYCSLGHAEPALTNPGVANLLDAAVRWVSGD